MGRLAAALGVSAGLLTAIYVAACALPDEPSGREVTTVRILQDSVTLTGAGATVRLSVTGFNRHGDIIDLPVAVTWYSGLQLVATVDSTGLVTARGDGKTTITAKLASGGPSDEATVAVTGVPQELIAFQSLHGIEVVRPDGSQRTVLIPNGELSGLVYSNPAWSPDGSRLAMGGARWDWNWWDFGDCCVDVYTVSPIGSDSVHVSHHPSLDDEATWSADGTKIAFTSTRERLGECNSGIYVMNADGSNVHRLTDVPGADAAWSPDGSRVAFEGRCDYLYDFGTEIYVVNTDGTGVVNLTNTQYSDFQPAWSPDGLRLAFVSSRDSLRYAIWVMNADGSGAKQLTADLVFDGKPIGASNPAWSPDGTQIVFVGIEQPCYQAPCLIDLYLMRADGTDVQRLTNTSSEFVWGPTWRVSSPLPAALRVSSATGRGGTER